MSFSERHGFRPVRSTLQVDSADKELRASLWNVVITNFFGRALDDSLHWERFSEKPRAMSVWVHLFKAPIDDFPDRPYKFVQFLRKRIFDGAWWESYDIIEFCLQNFGSEEVNFEIAETCNAILERERSAWRVIGCTIARLMSEQEIAAIEEVEGLGGPFAGVSKHMQNAVRLLSDRHSPDYPNAIKEAISAVEGTCQVITSDSKATLSKALKKLEGKGVLMHSAAQVALDKLYAYTNDADGIRHAEIDASTVDYEDAKFMLVACSAFVNLLIARFNEMKR